MGEGETPVWKGRPSQVVNLWTFLVCAVVAALLVVFGVVWKHWIFYVLLLAPAAVAGYRWLGVRCYTYEVTSERIRVRSGIFSRQSSELELYRVKDTTVLEPVFLRILGLGNIVMQTSDRTSPRVVIRAVRNVVDLRESLRTHIERLRAKKRVREVDFQ